MRLNLIYIWIFSLLQAALAQSVLKTSSLLTCMDNSKFTASFFDVRYFPHNTSVYFQVNAISSLDTNVTAQITLIAYGLNILSRNVSLCNLNYPEICPLTSGHLDLTSSYNVSRSITDQIPGIAFTIPDLDARVRVTITEDGKSDQLACVEAVLTNGKTVQTKYAAWPIAAIAGLGVITSGVVSVIGHSNTAAHIASNSMSLFVYFQSLAITAMMAVAKVPPIAAAWAQNFQWSLGIVRVGFVQNIANWYLQATGGTPTDILGSQYLSISVQKKLKKRAYELFESFYKPQESVVSGLSKRASITLDSDDFGYSDSLNSTLYSLNEKDKDLSSKILVLRGIQRVAFLTRIEITDLFMTGIIFLLFFAFVMVVCLMLFKAIIEILIRAKLMNEGKFNEYRSQWSLVIKGTLYRLFVLALPQIAVLCLWELTTRDSVGTTVIAVFLFVLSVVLLFQAAIRVFMFGRKSVSQYKNPAYLLYGDGAFLNKFGFLYVQFRADCYYFILVSLVYMLAKSLFVAVLQTHGKVQSVIVFVIELAYCVLVSWIRPFMDKRTNAFNITIAVISTLNALFFMFFSFVFRQPHVVASVMGVVYFVINAVFALFCLIFTVVTCVLALLYKNPDARYQPMKDDRVSFLPRFDNPKQAQNGEEDLELMALGATARKGHEHGGKPANLYDEDESMYEEDSMFPNKDSRNESNSNSNFNFSHDANDSKHDSYLETMEPTQPGSTIVGNPGAITGYHNSAYVGGSSRGPPVNPYSQSTSYNTSQSGSRVNFI
ncbi:predicted protein [Scheffersomyces stipitis CBS 6054]|uniref:ML-like domain-containing protein n=1 Tax=Scheffersomyces stipitis (strain ATCC 58785 / CBS 6054 / NBRC 10063 / NRRL Y-11545) TaxID=322104 RepID=A3LYX1_PICST|nr:predicted protein [Scheffersomyces stipitis CBS 6054]ABN68240.2 predicted protein [Scheffersomyces stipitis CBS 6054]KAG2731319.1 hypothetical protein G9P44_005735 [Scheffersomyces stipitis]